MIDRVVAADEKLAGGLRYMRRRLGADDALFRLVDDFFDEYCRVSGISAAAAAAAYDGFTRRYADDLEAYRRQGTYPVDRMDLVPPVDRVTYDIFLIASVLLTPHRYALMKAVRAGVPEASAACVIGVGAGLELVLLAQSVSRVIAYDLSISPVVRRLFPATEFRQRAFGGGEEAVPLVLAVELLEHLPDPVAFMAEIYQAVMPGGRVIATIARNTPQFDHLVNFDDVASFEDSLFNIGYKLKQKDIIPHFYMLNDVGAEYVIYILERPLYACQSLDHGASSFGHSR
jgi:hypothetical protein